MSLNVSSQLSSGIAQLNASLLQDALGGVSKTRDFSSAIDTSFAQKGDARYNEVADTDQDGKLSYDEYMKYCAEHAVSEYSGGYSDTVVQHVVDPVTQLQSLRPLSFGRVTHAYTASGMSGLHRSIIECEV